MAFTAPGDPLNYERRREPFSDGPRLAAEDTSSRIVWCSANEFRRRHWSVLNLRGAGSSELVHRLEELTEGHLPGALGHGLRKTSHSRYIRPIDK